jgi:hypothetical protein
MLKNPVYRGILEYTEGGHSREQQRIERDRRKQGIPIEPRSKERRYEAHEPMVTEGEYKLIEWRMQDNRRYARTGIDRPRLVLSGLVLCGGCHLRMTGHHTIDKRYGRRYANYECRTITCSRKGKSLSARVIERQLIDALRCRADELAKLASQPIEERPNPELLECERQIAELQQLYKKTPLEGLRSAIAELQQKLKKLELPTATPQVDAAQLALVLADERSWMLLSSEERRQVYHDLVQEIVIHDRGNIAIALNF